MLRFIPLLFPLALANCGAILASIELAERVDEAERLEALIQTADGSTLTPISDEEINSRTGTVQYEGQAAMVIPQGNDNDIILSARANVTANFQNDTIQADFFDWLGYRDGDNLGNTAQGDVVFSNGVIGTPESAAEITGDVAGDLTFKGEEFTVDGVINGQFSNFEGGEGVGGLTVAEETVITQNGDVVADAEFGFAGTR